MKKKTWTTPKVHRKATTHEKVKAFNRNIISQHKAEAAKAARDKNKKKPK